MHVKLIKPYVQLRARRIKSKLCHFQNSKGANKKPRMCAFRPLKGVTTDKTTHLRYHLRSNLFVIGYGIHLKSNHFGTSNHERSFRPAAIEEKLKIYKHQPPKSLCCRIAESRYVPHSGPLTPSSRKPRNLHVFTSYGRSPVYPYYPPYPWSGPIKVGWAMD